MFVRVVFIVNFCIVVVHGQTCSVPVVCTGSDGMTFRSWRSISSFGNQQVGQNTEPTQPARPTQSVDSNSMNTLNLFGGGPGISASERILRLSQLVQLLKESGWFYVNNGYQYWISRPRVSVPYSNAEQICRSMGSHIAVAGIRNNSSRNYIVNNIVKRYSNIHGLWIGYKDVGPGRIFRWNDGENFTDGESADWAQGQPDNDEEQDNDYCAVIARYFDYKWDDVPCETATNGVLCERFIGVL